MSENKLRSQRTALVFAYVCSALLGGALVLASGLAGGRGSRAEWLAVLGDALALLVLSLVSLQFLLSSRFHWLERSWGLDRLLALHRRMGPVIGLLAVAHPVVLLAALGSSPDAKDTELYAHFAHWGMWMGVVAGGAVAVQLLTTYLVEELGLSYERWRSLHRGALIIVAATYLHGWLVGPHFEGVRLVAGLATVWLVAVLATVSYTTFIKPARLRRSAYRVVEVTRETHDTWTVRMAPPEGEVFEYLPGQFIFLALYREGFAPEEHPFTLSSSPTQRDAITVTPKAVGDFTKTIKDTRPGDLAAVDGPYGCFTYLDVKDEPLLLIAGGIGLTPFASYLRYMRDTGAWTDVVLIDANKNEADITFRQELEQMTPRDPRLRIVHVLSEAGDDWEGERGYVDEALLRRHVPDLTERVCFLCGPPPMMRIVRSILANLGVPRFRIRFEEFRLK